MKKRWCFLSVAVTLVTVTASSQWVPTNMSTGNIVSLALCGTDIFAGYYGAGGIRRSSDAGSSWIPVNNGLLGSTLRALAVYGGSVLAGDYGEGVFMTTNRGGAWTPINNQNDRNIRALAVSGTRVYAGSTNSGIYMTTDTGATWTHSLPGGAYSAIRSLAAADSIVFAGTLGGVMLSTDFGTSWTPLSNGFPAAPSYAVGFKGTRMLSAASGHGIYRSTNGGDDWVPASLGLPDSSSLSTQCFLFTDSDILVATSKGVFRSTDEGASWIDVSDGLNTKWVTWLVFLPPCVYASTEGGGVWMRPLSEILTSAPFERSAVPYVCVLHQNYPNPFNPVTSIRYTVGTGASGGVAGVIEPGKEGVGSSRAAENERVRLAVYDILGREVSVLVDGPQESGTYVVRWDAARMTSGLYYCRMTAGSFSSAVKMLLMR